MDDSEQPGPVYRDRSEVASFRSRRPSPGFPDRPTLSADELGPVEAQVQKRLEAWELDLTSLPATGSRSS